MDNTNKVADDDIVQNDQISNSGGNSFSVTDSAAKQIKNIINSKIKQDPSLCIKALRVSVEGGGCAGFSYKYEFVNDIAQNDIVIENKDFQTKVVIDDISIGFINGATLDFIEELGKQYFAIKNPSSTSKCGCGNSFGI